MEAVKKALWYIESHSAGPLTLGDVAEASGLSRFHLARVFPAVTGYSVFAYLRARRLTEAARELVDGAPDILSVALDAGYGSHEAFTRAFRDLVGLTPEEVRARRRLDDLSLVEPIRMSDIPAVDLAKPIVPRYRRHARSPASASITATRSWAAFPPSGSVSTRISATSPADRRLRLRRLHAAAADDHDGFDYIAASPVTLAGRTARGAVGPARPGATLCGVRAQGPHLVDRLDLCGHLQRLAAGIGRQDRRGPADDDRALRRTLRSAVGQGRAGDLGAAQRLSASHSGPPAIVNCPGRPASRSSCGCRSPTCRSG